jgi:asparagine synthetase B (glutamine-hydrolysing)
VTELLLGAQPITDAKGHIALSVNGEIYNYVELGEDLKRDHPQVEKDFTTDSDCEVLLHLYKKHGPGEPSDLVNTGHLLNSLAINLQTFSTKYLSVACSLSSCTTVSTTFT